MEIANKYKAQVLSLYQTERQTYAGQDVLSKLVQFDTSDSRTVNVFDFGDVPQIQRIRGSVPIKHIGQYNMAMELYPWGHGIGVDKRDLERHGLSNGIKTRISSMARMMTEHVGQLIERDLLPALEATTTLDGQYFFDNDHPINGGVQSNLLYSLTVADVTAPTMVECLDVFDELMLKLSQLKSDTDAFRNIAPEGFILFVPWEWVQPMSRLFHPDVTMLPNVGGGAYSNPVRTQNVRVIPAAHNPITNNIADVMLFAFGGGVRPAFLHVEYAPPELEQDYEIQTGEQIMVSSCIDNATGLEYRSAIMATVANT